MELVIDIGNSYTKFALIKHNDVIHFFSLKTSTKISLAPLKKFKVDAVIISSVVNKITPIVIKQLKKITTAKIYDIAKLSKNIKMKVKCHPSEIGSDLYADLIGAIDRYHGPLAIFDLGTVNKVMAIDKNDTFVGASFFSGLEGSVRSMFYDTDKLPEINLTYAKDFIGKSTTACINNGVLYSLVYSLKGFIASYKKLLGKDTKIIITGGSSSLIKPIIKGVIYNPYLTLLGAYYIYKENNA